MQLFVQALGACSFPGPVLMKSMLHPQANAFLYRASHNFHNLYYYYLSKMYLLVLKRILLTACGFQLPRDDPGKGEVSPQRTPWEIPGSWYTRPLK